MKSSIELTVEQKIAVSEIVSRIKSNNKQVTFGGCAGSGKSTIVNFLLQIFDNYAVAAFTGKAADVLRRKGNPTARTIHSLIYEPIKHYDGTVTFDLLDSIPYDGIIIDEASMVSLDIYNDLTSFNLPIIFVGDHFQLEPIGSKFNIMKDPQVKLETVHRNANEIAKFAEWIRHGEKPTRFQWSRYATGKNVKFAKKWNLGTDLYLSVDQVVCAFNKTRVGINNKIRESLGRKQLLEEGDKIMCLRNNRKYGVYNGMQGLVTEYWKEKKRHYLSFETNDDFYYKIRFDPLQLGKETTITEYIKEGPLPFDYAYAITAHKSQGDQFRRVLVLEQTCKNFDHQRWCYTSASRAEELLVWQPEK